MLKMLFATLMSVFLSAGMAYNASAEETFRENVVDGLEQAKPELTDEEVQHFEELRQSGRQQIERARKLQKQKARELRGKRRRPDKRPDERRLR